MDFKIKANETARGSCTFEEPNTIAYKSVINQPMENVIQKTPILVLHTVSVDHGIYKGLKDGKAEYLNNFDFVDDSVVTFATNINDLYKDNANISLNTLIQSRILMI